MSHDLRHAPRAAARIAALARGVFMRSVAVAALALVGGLPLQAQEKAQEKTQDSAAAPIKVAFIDQLSGPLANVGQIFQANLKFALDDANAQGGVLGRNYALVSYDNKLSAQESLIALQSAIDAGVHVVFTGASGSPVVTALVEAVNRHNERNPGQRVLIMNYASLDPDLTGARCSFWHFATEANTAMKMRALANFAREQKGMRKVYLLNQDYTQGRIWAALGRQMIAGARPDVQFVGEALHPLARVKDFAPYMSRIKESGADTVVTGNWGQDLSLLIKAGGEAGYELNYLNHSGGGAPGTVLAVSQAKNAHLTWVAEYLPNGDDPVLAALAARVRQTPAGEYFAPRVLIAVQILSEAIRRARSDDPTSIAFALEGMQYRSPVGDVLMRKSDHQLLLPQVVSTVAPVDGKTVKVGVEGTQYGFRLDSTTAGGDLNLPSVCRMKRPTGT
ncbi:branched-chain amino acid ABC transporter substrate-binding protein [Cupriavidus basilensis]|uniref:Branched-chain amino acid ABC transporter substrate-binding protein n=1 Tax=Cupriavidus basilensis TaxID=68895 RepID=A0A643FWR7_9BURK|nr:branched-chain amino acid ABC transporter substrate-binding protein [Cupriavidus basilensis]QOT76045.1 branched-chain amino acid ABC transporter substrate-binding protein [Cupriavidus basilensis]